MISGLLHQRTGGAGSSGVIASPAYALTQGFAVGQYSAEVTAGFTIKPNGTWETSEPWYADESGVWYSPITTDAGAGYEVKITPTRLTVTESGVTDAAGTITNGAENWVPLSVDRAIALKLQRFTQGRSIASYSVKVEIRPIGGTNIISTRSFSFGVQVQVDQNIQVGEGPGDWGGGGIPGQVER
ncbi:hypothetical protein [Stenotrophomonas sp. PS02298]|uniref:hypothetical protein n=1 Tax=Stenotrophomonas sp. PS02298 TaxID=2991424 RepID=UPI00249A93B8|nr:hypothetical protein [Stenotrophomonas sp. PS02298]